MMIRKIIPKRFYLNLPHCVVCEEYREFRNNVCSYQTSHKVSLSSVICKNVYIDYSYRSDYNPTCSRECYVNYKNIPCSDCQNIFLKTSFSPRCYPCYELIKQKLENYNPKDSRILAHKYKLKRRKKQYVKSELLFLNPSML